MTACPATLAGTLRGPRSGPGPSPAVLPSPLPLFPKRLGSPSHHLHLDNGGGAGRLRYLHTVFTFEALATVVGHLVADEVGLPVEGLGTLVTLVLSLLCVDDHVLLQAAHSGRGSLWVPHLPAAQEGRASAQHGLLPAAPWSPCHCLLLRGQSEVWQPVYLPPGQGKRGWTGRHGLPTWNGGGSQCVDRARALTQDHPRGTQRQAGSQLKTTFTLTLTLGLRKTGSGDFQHWHEPQSGDEAQETQGHPSE